MTEFDGRYYAKHRAVYRAPLRSPTGISMGFCVCELCDGVDDDGAQEIADALNAAEDKRKNDALIVAVIESQEA